MKQNHHAVNVFGDGIAAGVVIALLVVAHFVFEAEKPLQADEFRKKEFVVGQQFLSGFSYGHELNSELTFFVNHFGGAIIQCRGDGAVGGGDDVGVNCRVIVAHFVPLFFRNFGWIADETVAVR